eukprot:3994549-Heterocapsa_arctica.AAC.1
MSDSFSSTDDQGIQLKMLETSPKLLAHHLHEAWLRRLARVAAASIGWHAGQRVYIEHIQNIMSGSALDPNHKN